MRIDNAVLHKEIPPSKLFPDVGNLQAFKDHPSRRARVARRLWSAHTHRRTRRLQVREQPLLPVSEVISKKSHRHPAPLTQQRFSDFITEQIAQPSGELDKFRRSRG